jgi:phenylalanine ammonia-lyase
MVINGSVRPANGDATGIVLFPSNSESPAAAVQSSSTLLFKFVETHKELESYKYVDHVFLIASGLILYHRNGRSVRVDGRTLSIAAVAATARHHAKVELDDSPEVRARLAKSRKVITDKVQNGTSVYGLSTGFGGSGRLKPRVSSSLC